MDTGFFRELAQNLIRQQVFSEDFVLPDYQGLNLKNVLPQIATIFGIATPNCSNHNSDCLAEFGGVKKVMLVIFDGLGYNRLLSHLSNRNGVLAEFAEKGMFKPITTVFPSTTSTALTSLFSGLSPAQHQIIGYHMFSKKYGLIYNTLDMKPVYGYSGKVELARDYAHQILLLAPIFEERGVRVSVITKGHIVGSGLSQITHRDLSPVSYILGSDMWTHAAQTLENPGSSLSVVYYSGVDSLAHKYGAYSKEVSFELTSIEHNVEDFIEGLNQSVKQETLLVFVADHGIAEVGESIYLKDYPEIMQHLLLPPVGDGRASYLFCKHSHEEALRRIFEGTLAGFKLFSTDDLVKQGAFGEPISRWELEEKLGSFTVLSNSKRLLGYPYFDEDRQNPQRGAHGGMTAEEMIVPLLSVKLSQL